MVRLRRFSLPQRSRKSVTESPTEMELLIHSAPQTSGGFSSRDKTSCVNHGELDAKHVVITLGSPAAEIPLSEQSCLFPDQATDDVSLLC